MQVFEFEPQIHLLVAGFKCLAASLNQSDSDDASDSDYSPGSASRLARSDQSTRLNSSTPYSENISELETSLSEIDLELETIWGLEPDAGSAGSDSFSDSNSESSEMAAAGPPSSSNNINNRAHETTTTTDSSIDLKAAVVPKVPKLNMSKVSSVAAEAALATDAAADAAEDRSVRSLCLSLPHSSSEHPLTLPLTVSLFLRTSASRSGFWHRRIHLDRRGLCPFSLSFHSL